jgi:heat shock protein HslJ
MFKKLLVIALAANLGACSTPSTNLGALSTAEGIIGTWKVQSGSRDIPNLAIAFADNGTITGTAECNTISAHYQLTADRLTISDSDITALSCGGRPKAAEVESMARNLLTSSPFRVSQHEKGTLVLTSAAGSWRLKRITN